MLGLDNPIHILFLPLVVLLVFGAKRLPEMGHFLGRGLRGFADVPGVHHPIPTPCSGSWSLSRTFSSGPSVRYPIMWPPATP